MNHNTNILGYRNLPEGLRHTGWEPLSYGVMFLIHKNGETNSIYLMEFTGRYKEIQFTSQLRAEPELIAVGIYLGWVKTGITAGSRGNLEIALPGGDACVLNLQQDPAVGRDRRRLVGGRQRREVGLPGFHTSAPGAVVHICPYSLLSKDSEIFWSTRTALGHPTRKSDENRATFQWLLCVQESALLLEAVGCAGTADPSQEKA